MLSTLAGVIEGSRGAAASDGGDGVGVRRGADAGGALGDGCRGGCDLRVQVSGDAKQLFSSSKDKIRIHWGRSSARFVTDI